MYRSQQDNYNIQMINLVACRIIPSTNDGLHILDLVRLQHVDIVVNTSRKFCVEDCV